jgi:hypothetical protein
MNQFQEVGSIVPLGYAGDPPQQYYSVIPGNIIYVSDGFPKKMLDKLEEILTQLKRIERSLPEKK